LRFARTGAGESASRAPRRPSPTSTPSARRHALTDAQVFEAHKRQPSIEKRFEQTKTAFEIAPVLLKNEGRNEALFFVYFLALLVQAIIERELRLAMQRDGVEMLALYFRKTTDPSSHGRAGVPPVQPHPTSRPRARRPTHAQLRTGADPHAEPSPQSARRVEKRLPEAALTLHPPAR
jgi:hypothetical protein